MKHISACRLFGKGMLFGLFGIALISTAFNGCGGSKEDATGETKIRIGFLVKQPEEPWFQHEWKFAQKCADQYGFELMTIGATDGEKVLAAIDTLAAKGAEGFVICTPDVRLGPAIMARANSYNMKVITVDDQFVGADNQFMDVPYMGISARSIGEAVGKALFEEAVRRDWQLEGTAVCIPTSDELDTVKQRTDGAADALVACGFPADLIYRVPMKKLDVPSALDAANIVLTQHPEVKRWLVCSVNDEGVIGAVRAMEGLGFNKDTIIGIGIGGSTCRAEFEKQEVTGFFATALISPLRHGFETAENLYKWIKDGIEPPKIVKTEGIIVTRENYHQVMQEQGLADVGS